MAHQKWWITFYQKIKKPLLFFLYFSFFLAFFLLVKRTFSVSTIDVLGDKNLKGAIKIKGKIIFFISSSKTERELVNLNPEVKKAKIIKIYPNKIRIEVEKDSPVVSFSVAGGYFFLGQEGRILAKKKEGEKNLPSINYYQKLHYQGYDTGEKLSYKDILDSLYFLVEFNYLGIRINSIDINSLNMIIFNLGDKKIFFTTSKKREEQYQTLKKLIERFKIEKVEYESIDLRFEKPIVKLK
jgi:cell division septal protein FtsQ